MRDAEVEQEEHPLEGLSFNLLRDMDIPVYYQKVTT